jgi:hypothetical protein
MSPLTKAKVLEEKKNYTQYILPAYITISAIFIVLVAYSYFQGVVYNSGTLRGQQQWYEAAYVEVVNAVSQKCEAVTLEVWETSVSIVNVACLQQTPDAQAVPSQDISATWE